MRVLFIPATFPPRGMGGGPIGAELIARGLAEQGHELRVVTVADEETLASSNGYEIKTIGSLNVYWNYWSRKHAPYQRAIWHTLENFNPRALVRMRREIREFDPDIVVTVSVENINVATWLASRLEDKPVAHVIQSAFLMCWKGPMFRNGHNCRQQCLDCRLFSTGKKALSRYVNGVTGESHFIVHLHLQRGYFPNAKSHIIPGCVNFSGQAFIRRRANENVLLRVGYIGRFAPGKGLETLAKAAHALSEQNNTQFYVAGDGVAEHKHAYREIFPLATEFLGWVDPETFFQRIDVVVVPSTFNEAFGRVSPEAMFCGVPAIVSRVGGLAEHVVDGQNGYTFAPGDAAELTGIIRRLAADRHHLAVLAANATEYAKRFEFKRVSSAYASFCEDTVTASQGGL